MHSPPWRRFRVRPPVKNRCPAAVRAAGLFKNVYILAPAILSTSGTRSCIHCRTWRALVSFRFRITASLALSACVQRSGMTNQRNNPIPTVTSASVRSAATARASSTRFKPLNDWIYNIGDRERRQHRYDCNPAEVVSEVEKEEGQQRRGNPPKPPKRRSVLNADRQRAGCRCNHSGHRSAE